MTQGSPRGARQGVCEGRRSHDVLDTTGAMPFGPRCRRNDSHGHIHPATRLATVHSAALWRPWAAPFAILSWFLSTPFPFPQFQPDPVPPRSRSRPVPVPRRSPLPPFQGIPVPYRARSRPVPVPPRSRSTPFPFPLFQGVPVPHRSRSTPFQGVYRSTLLPFQHRSSCHRSSWTPFQAFPAPHRSRSSTVPLIALPVPSSMRQPSCKNHIPQK